MTTIIFVFGAIMDINVKDKTGYLLFIGVWLKIAHEQIYGASTDVSDLIEASVAVDAHLWGAIGGLIFVIFYWIFYREILHLLLIHFRFMNLSFLRGLTLLDVMSVCNILIFWYNQNLY